MPPAKRVKRESEDENSPAKKVARRSPAPKKQTASPRVKKAPVKASPARSVSGAEDEDETGSIAGLKIVVTGVTEMIGREALEHKLKDAGAQVTSAVSGVTNVLIHGPKLEDGREFTEGTKYRKAKELVDTGKSKAGLKILSEAEFFEAYPNIAPRPIAAIGSKSFTPGPALPEGKAASHFLWSEKWRPSSEADFVFNREAYAGLKSWLLNWNPYEESEKAALLCGSPGVGKTSSVLAVCKENGFHLLEFNASDSRSQKILKGLAHLTTGGTTLSKGQLSDKLVMLMDEADGLSAGDRGGSQELGKMIKTSRIPIVCTCNDKTHPKVRTLARLCRVFTFSKPDRLSAVRRALQIANAEGFSTTESFVTTLYDASNGDMRQLLNSLQLSLMGTPSQTPGTLKNMIIKDVDAGDDPFASVRRLFASGEIDYNGRIFVFFSDYDMIPLIVQENYLKLLLKRPQDVGLMMTVADSISFSDILSSKIRGQGHWDLLPAMGYFSTVFPTQKVRGSMFRVDFPKTLGRISSTNKHKRQYAELAAATGHGGKRWVVDGYYEMLGEEAVSPLLKESIPIPERIENFFDFLHAYGLSKEQVIENLMDTRNSKSVKPYDKVETKAKTALTRAYVAQGKPGEITHKAARGGAKGTQAKKASPKKSAKGVIVTSSSEQASAAPKPAKGRRTTRVPPVAATPPEPETEEEEMADGDLAKEREEEEAKMGGIF